MARGMDDGLGKDGKAARRELERRALELFADGSPREILGRLCDGDPLGLDARTAKRAARDAFFVDRDRWSKRAFARVAYRACDYRSNVSLEPWIEARVGEAARDLLEEQQDEELRGISVHESMDAEYYGSFARDAGMEVGLARTACVALNQLPVETRRAFHALVVERLTIAACVERGLGNEEQVEGYVRQAIRAIEAAIHRTDNGTAYGGDSEL